MSRSLQHHANLLISSPARALDHLYSLCRELNISVANNPDLVFFSAEIFGIDEARKLGILASRKAIIGPKIFFISPTRITIEAQNALLKTFEEPFPLTFFFLVLRDESVLLPTLKSRMQAVRLSDDRNFVALDMVDEFLSLSLQKKLLFAQKFADEKGNLESFLDGLLLRLREEKNTEERLKKVYTIRNSIRGYSLPPRMVLEHLSLVL